MTKTFYCGLLASCSLFLAGAMADPTLTLDPPNGAISGLAGTTVGWGFTLTNNTDYLGLDQTQFCLTNALPCFPSTMGTYKDLAAPQNLFVGPDPDSTSITQAFDNSLGQGAGSFTINADAAGTETGFIIFTYDLWTEDPNIDLDAEFISGSNILSAPASVTVGSPVPEPVTLPLLGLVSIAGALLRRRKLA
jgi:hypothetical protein